MCGMSFSPPPVRTRGKGYWKLNLQYLTHPDYTTLIRNFWQEWRGIRGDYPDPLKWWDCGKLYIKSLTIQYASDLYTTRRSRKFSLLEDLRLAR